MFKIKLLKALPLFPLTEVLWQMAWLLEWCLLHYYLQKTRRICEEAPGRENMIDLYSWTTKCYSSLRCKQKHYLKYESFFNIEKKLGDTKSTNL